MSSTGSISGSTQDGTLTVNSDPKFSGSISDVPAGDWIRAIRARVRSRGLTGLNTVFFATSNLTGTAAQKFDPDDGDAYVGHEDALESWPKWDRLFQSIYCHSTTPAEAITD